MLYGDYLGGIRCIVLGYSNLSILAHADFVSSTWLSADSAVNVISKTAYFFMGKDIFLL